MLEQESTYLCVGGDGAGERYAMGPSMNKPSGGPVEFTVSFAIPDDEVTQAVVCPVTGAEIFVYARSGQGQVGAVCELCGPR